MATNESRFSPSFDSATPSDAQSSSGTPGEGVHNPDLHSEASHHNNGAERQELRSQRVEAHVRSTHEIVKISTLLTGLFLMLVACLMVTRHSSAQVINPAGKSTKGDFDTADKDTFIVLGSGRMLEDSELRRDSTNATSRRTRSGETNLLPEGSTGTDRSRTTGSRSNELNQSISRRQVCTASPVFEKEVWPRLLGDDAGRVGSEGSLPDRAKNSAYQAEKTPRDGRLGGCFTASWAVVASCLGYKEPKRITKACNNLDASVIKTTIDSGGAPRRKCNDAR